jgi:hypothetical protein
MWELLEKYLRKHGFYRRRIEQALDLERRGEARKDGLQLGEMQHRLEIRWRARGVHPWDRHLDREERQARFIEQALIDTEAAIARLFKALPEVDLIDLCVTEPGSDATMLSGTVHRSDLQNVQPSSPSVRMRLMEMGVNFESLETDYNYQVRV